MANLRLSAYELRVLTSWPEAVVNDYISAINDLSELGVMIVSTGNPEGVVEANESRQYFDSALSKFHVNPNVGAKTGWVLINP